MTTTTTLTHPDRPVCPECKAGKHGNCEGITWDFDTDTLTTCGCREPHAWGGWA